MAKILETSLDDSLKFSNHTHPHVYNGKIYVQTQTEIIVYNPILNIIEERITKQKADGNLQKVMMARDNLLYYISGYYGSGGSVYEFVNTYNIDTKSFNLGTTDMYSSGLDYVGVTTQNQTFGVSKHASREARYIFNMSRARASDYSTYPRVISANQLIYIDGNVYSLGTGGFQNSTASYITNNMWVYPYNESANSFGTPTYTSNSSAPLRACSGFLDSDAIYYFGGEQYVDGAWSTNYKIYKYTISNSVMVDTGINIPSRAVFNPCTLYGDTYYSFTAEGILKLSFVEYDLTFDIKSEDGASVLTSITNASPITKVLFEYNDSTSTLAYKFTTLSGDIIGNVRVDNPEGKRIVGLSLSAKGRINFPLGTEVTVSIYQNTSFYISNQTYRPPATVFDITLYQNSAEVNRVDKGQFLTPVGSLLGALRDECSMLTPSIVYQSPDVPTFNYVYIPIFNRYYFVTSLSSVSKNVWRMELNCDVLMSYKNEILLLQGVVGRQEIDFNPMLVDSELPTQDNPEVEIVNIPSTAFLSHTNITGNLYNFVLTVIG